MPNFIGQSVYLAHSDGGLEYIGRIYELTDEHLAIIYHDAIICYYRLNKIGWRARPLPRTA